MSFIPVPAKNPTKEPKAGFIEAEKLFPSTSISAIRAPTKAPTIIPIGGKNIIPMIIPTREALEPACDPPKRFVKKAGMI